MPFVYFPLALEMEPLGSKNLVDKIASIEFSPYQDDPLPAEEPYRERLHSVHVRATQQVLAQKYWSVVETGRNERSIRFELRFRRVELSADLQRGVGLAAETHDQLERGLELCLRIKMGNAPLSAPKQKGQMEEAAVAPYYALLLVRPSFLGAAS